MSEFTGERVIPGLVDADLFNEHRARYNFASRFMQPGDRVLDAACGTGYGAAELGAVALDISSDAVLLAHAVAASVVQASCEAMPFADGSFDLIAAFEMIEHLRDAGAFLADARRILRTGGVLLVSTPNRAYYAESRASAGPNPFHTHEYGYDEFRAALKSVFTHVHLWTQNHAAAIVFAPVGDHSRELLQTTGCADTATAHFFLAACSMEPLPVADIYAWIPNSGNVLREREQHIARLEGELTRKNQWLADLHESHAALQTAHAATEVELRQRNIWAEGLNREIAQAASAIEALEREAEERLAWVRQLQADLASARDTVVERTAWARSLETEKDQAIAAYRELETTAEIRLAEAAAALSQANARYAEHLRLIAASRWIKLGRKLKVGPEIA
jgi:SAM-dependent methyltransferase